MIEGTYTFGVYDLLMFVFCSKLVRRDIKRIHEDIDLANRKRQSIENSLRDSREKLLSLEHNRDFKVGLELQLFELQEALQGHKSDCEVSL